MIWLLLLQLSWVSYLAYRKRWRATAGLGLFWLVSWMPLFSGLAFSELWLGHFKAPSLVAALMPWLVNKQAVKLSILLLGAVVFAGLLGVHWIPVYGISHGESAIGVLLAVAIAAIIFQNWLLTVLALTSMLLVASGQMLTALWLDVWLWLWCLVTLPVDMVKRYWGRSSTKPAS